jgi:hypothetical protein
LLLIAEIFSNHSLNPSLAWACRWYDNYERAFLRGYNCRDCRLIITMSVL